MTFTHFELEFTREGKVFSSAQLEEILKALDRFTDVIVLAHGWNNDMREARELYDKLFASIDRLTGSSRAASMEGRRFGVIRLFWPSKKFADEKLLPGGAASKKNQDDALSFLLERLKEDPERLPEAKSAGGEGKRKNTRTKAVSRAQSLIGQLETDAAAREQFINQLRSILDEHEAGPDDGSDAFFHDPPEVLFANLAALGSPGSAPPPQGAVSPARGRGSQGGEELSGGAARRSAGNLPESASRFEGAAGLGDVAHRIKEAALNLVRIATYSQMKQRAGLVGREGLAPLIQQLRSLEPALKVHLVGHSFGGRLVTAAANSLPPGTQGVSVTLLQAAFSHNGLAAKFDTVNDGEFVSLLAEKRVSGPIVITHTKNDRAVGLAYPIASRFTRDKAAALGDENDPYGGMGRNGAQKLHKLARQGELGGADAKYEFSPGLVYNLRADTAIRDHGDVTNEMVAAAVLDVILTN